MALYAKSYAFMHDSLQCMTLGTTLYSIWHAVNGKQSVAAAHLQATAYAADLPFGNGPVNLGGVAGAAGPKTWIFDVLGPGWPPRTPGGPKLYVLSRSAPF